MKKKLHIPLFPFFFAFYPIWALLARNPGEILPSMAIRFSIIFSGLTWLTIWFMYKLTNDRLRSLLLGTLLVWFLSSSGHVYRIMLGYTGPSAMRWLHPVLIMTSCLLVVFLAQKSVWEKLRPERWERSSFSYLNLLGGLSLVTAILPIIQFWTTAHDDTRRPWNELIATEEVTISNPVRPPDIYYIILDGYGRHDMLEQVYEFDNHSFIDFLQTREFFVAESARSNYIQTPLSLSSSLNFEYINFAKSYAGPRSINRLPLFALLSDNRVRKILESVGYGFITTSSGYPFTEFTNADTYLYPYQPTLNELERFYLGTTAIDALISTDTSVGNSLRYYLPLPGYEASRERIIFSLNELARIPEFEGPKFVFVHIVGPHPPFVLSSSGAPVHPNRPYLPGDGEAVGDSPEEYQRQYVEQLIFINTQMEIAIDAILEKSSHPPVILVQGDHGPGSLLIRDSIQSTCLLERTSILSAYYFPYDTPELSHEISPVNSFRVVFNTYFGTDLNMLPDRTYFSPQSWPYDFTDVTGEIETACGQ